MRHIKSNRYWPSRGCKLVIVVFFFDLLVFPDRTLAQTFELGVQFTGMHLHKIDEAPLGVGTRFDYNFRSFAAAELELMHYPENPSGNFGESTVMLGTRLGKHFDRFGVFGIVRSGVIHFGGGYFTQRLDQKTHSMMDVGGALEYYPNRRTVMRIDLGDAIVYYGNARLFNRPNPDGLGTVHNLQPGFGFGFRF